MHDVRRMVALGVKSGREREHVAGTKLHTEATGFTTLYDNGNASFCHGISTLGAVEHSPDIWRDYAWRRRGAM
jgi:hypothetical protein